MNVWLAIVFLLIFTSSTVAWGPKTHEFFCKETVINVWGHETYSRCFERISRQQLCSAAGDQYMKTCFNNPVQPWVMPDYLFKDFELHEDYSNCPINKGYERNWICGNTSENYATRASEVWFSLAKNSSNLCQRVHRFCIGSNYFAKSFFPLHQTKHDPDKCRNSLKNNIDSFVENNSRNWSVREYCTFSTFEQRVGRSVRVTAHKTFIIDEEDVIDVLNNLSEKAWDIADDSFVVESGFANESMISLIVVNITKDDVTADIVNDITNRINESVGGIIDIFSKINESILADSTDQSNKDYTLVKWFMGLMIVLGTLSIVYAILPKRVLTHPITLPNLNKIPDLNEDDKKRLTDAGIIRIEKFIEQDSKKISEVTDIEVDTIEGWKKIFKQSFDEYFNIDSKLTHDDLTKKQQKVIREIKMDINKTMRVFRNKKKLTEKQQKDLHHIMNPLADDEKKQIQRIIDGVLDIREDQAYRLLVTSSETGMMRIEHIDWEKEIKGG